MYYVVCSGEQHSPQHQRRLYHPQPQVQAQALPSASLGYDLSERRLEEDAPVDTHEFDKYLKYQPELDHLQAASQHQLDSNHNYQQQVCTFAPSTSYITSPDSRVFQNLFIYSASVNNK